MSESHPGPASAGAGDLSSASGWPVCLSIGLPSEVTRFFTEALCLELGSGCQQDRVAGEGVIIFVI